MKKKKKNLKNVTSYFKLYPGKILIRISQYFVMLLLSLDPVFTAIDDTKSKENRSKIKFKISRVTFFVNFYQ